jgi:hypothetical protein
MKNVRWVAVLVFTTTIISLAAAQSNPVAHASQLADHSQARPFLNAEGLTAAAHGRRASQLASLNIADPVNYASGGYAQALAVADVNGDGKPDVVVANQWCGHFDQYGACLEFEGAVSVLLGNGDGTFQPEVTYDLGGPGVLAVAVADLNGDGKPDLVVAYNGNGMPTSPVGVLFGNGDGTFQSPVTYDSGGEAASTAIADVNGDGHPDLIVANGSSDTVGVLLNNGDGTFQSAVVYSFFGYFALSVAIGDVNGDGYPDLVVADDCGSCGGSILLNNGNGTFQSPIYYDAGQPISSVAAADLNGDGKLDLVAGVNYTQDVGDVSVLLGNGDGTFQPAVRYSPGGGSITSVAIADINGDGYLDLVVGNANGYESQFYVSGGVIGVLLGNGDGTFQAVTTYSSGGFSTGSVAVSDINGDGRPDIVASNSCNAILLDYYCDQSNNSPLGVLINVPPGAKTSTTTIGSSLNPWAYGAPLTLSATVTPPGGGTATGTVTFYDGWIDLGSAELSNNEANLSGIAPAFGWHLFSAGYSGSGSVPASTSAPLVQVANQATTTTAVIANVNPSYPGQTVTYTATVAGQYGGQVTGTVQFLQGERKHQTTVCTATLANAQATCSATYTVVGSYPITANYFGDANNSGSTSPRLSHTVRALPAATTTTVITSGSPSQVGQAVTFTATVASNLPVPDGETLAFYHGKTEIGTGMTSNGVAALTTSFAKTGKYTIKADYPGDASHKASSGTVKQVVNP